MVAYLLASVRTTDQETIESYTDSIWNGLFFDITKEWSEYKKFLQEKYPAPEGEEWGFTCEHHKKIDSLLNR